jgi:hypothetical protein
VIWPTPEAFRVKKQNPTISLIHTDLFDNKLLTPIKDYVTRFNVPCFLHGLTPPRGSRVDLDHLTAWQRRRGALDGEGQTCYKPHERVAGLTPSPLSWPAINGVLPPHRAGRLYFSLL